jgi:hypothetical protein
LKEHLRTSHDMREQMLWQCSDEPCRMEGVNQEVHFTSRSELVEHRAEAHGDRYAVNSEGSTRQGE